MAIDNRSLLEAYDLSFSTLPNQSPIVYRYSLKIGMPIQKAVDKIERFIHVDNHNIIGIFPQASIVGVFPRPQSARERIGKALQFGSRCLIVRSFRPDPAHPNLEFMVRLAKEKAQPTTPSKYTDCITWSFLERPTTCTQGHPLEKDFVDEWRGFSGTCPIENREVPHPVGANVEDPDLKYRITRFKEERPDIDDQALLAVYDPIYSSQDMKRYALKERIPLEVAASSINRFISSNPTLLGVFPRGLEKELQNGSRVTKYLIITNHRILCLTDKDEASAPFLNNSPHIDLFTGALLLENPMKCPMGHYFDAKLFVPWQKISHSNNCPFGDHPIGNEKFDNVWTTTCNNVRRELRRIHQEEQEYYRNARALLEAYQPYPSRHGYRFVLLEGKNARDAASAIQKFLTAHPETGGEFPRGLAVELLNGSSVTKYLVHNNNSLYVTYNDEAPRDAPSECVDPRTGSFIENPNNPNVIAFNSEKELLSAYKKIQSMPSVVRYELRNNPEPLRLARIINQYVAHHPVVTSVFPERLENALQNRDRNLVIRSITPNRKILCLAEKEAPSAALPEYIDSLTGALLREPVECSEHHYLEKEFCENWKRVSHSENCPLGNHLLGSLVMDEYKALRIRKFKVETSERANLISNANTIRRPRSVSSAIIPRVPGLLVHSATTSLKIVSVALKFGVEFVPFVGPAVATAMGVGFCLYRIICRREYKQAFIELASGLVSWIPFAGPFVSIALDVFNLGLDLHNIHMSKETNLPRALSILGLQNNPTQREVDLAFRNKAKLVHPDRFPNVPELRKLELNHSFQALKTAKECLYDHFKWK